jgi:hypothetical protein
MTTNLNEQTAPMQGNISIDLKRKNNPRPYTARPATVARPAATTRPSTATRPSTTARTSSQHSRPSFSRGGNAKITSEAFLRHINKAPNPSLAEMKKLIKRGEEPVKIVSLL